MRVGVALPKAGKMLYDRVFFLWIIAELKCTGSGLKSHKVLR
jgi:hypothetical protein